MLRLVNKVPPYLNEDYLMGFPIFEHLERYVASVAKDARPQQQTKKTSGCLFQ